MRSSLVRLAAVFVLLSAACAQTDEDAGQKQEQIGGRLEVAAVWTGAEQESFQKVLDEFADRTGTSVNFTSTGDRIATVLRTRIEGGNPPEVAILPQPGLMDELVEQDALQPIDDVVGDRIDAWGNDWRALGSLDENLYGLFFKGANKSTVWYNVGAFEEAEVEPPEDWDALKTAAGTLRDSGITPLSIGGEAGWVLTDWFENIYLRTAGADNYEKLATNEIPWTHESVKQALATFAEVLPFAAEQPSTVAFEESVDAVFSDEPTAAMVFEGDFVPGVTDAAKAATPGEDYDFFDFPSIEGSEPSVVAGGDMVVMLEASPQAEALVEFLSTPEAAEIWAEQGGFTSPNREVSDDAYPNEIAARAASTLAEAELIRFDLSDWVPTELGGDVPGSMWSILQDFTKNPEDVDGTAERLQEAAEKAYG